MILGNLEILINPYTAIRLFANTYFAVKEKILTDRSYKVTREAWIASMFLIAIGKVSGSNWWLTPVTDSGSPDFDAYSFTRNIDDKSTDKPHLKIEVFEWRKEDKELNFLEALWRVKLRKIIDPEITIVCYIRKNSKIPPAIELNKKIKNLKPHVKDIWYLGDVSGDSKIWRVTQIYPNTTAIDINYDQVLRTKEEHSFLHSYRGKSEKLEFELTGKQVILTSEFDLKLVE